MLSRFLAGVGGEYRKGQLTPTCYGHPRVESIGRCLRHGRRALAAGGPCVGDPRGRGVLCREGAHGLGAHAPARHRRPRRHLLHGLVEAILILSQALRLEEGRAAFAHRVRVQFAGRRGRSRGGGRAAVVRGVRVVGGRGRALVRGRRLVGTLGRVRGHEQALREAVRLLRGRLPVVEAALLEVGVHGAAACIRGGLGCLGRNAMETRRVVRMGRGLANQGRARTPLYPAARAAFQTRH